MLFEIIQFSKGAARTKQKKSKNRHEPFLSAATNEERKKMGVLPTYKKTIYTNYNKSFYSTV